MKKYLSLFIYYFGATSCLTSYAQNIPSYADDRRWQDERLNQQEYFTPTLNASIQNGESSHMERSVHLNEEELQQHPRLLGRALGAAVLANNAEDTEYLLSLYKRTAISAQDPTLTLWAEAVIARHSKHHNSAIRHYRSLLADYPDNPLVRLQLAATLAENQDWDAAEDQFLKLRSVSILPEALHQQIDQQLMHIRSQTQWQFYGSLSYIQDKNINNAPSQRDLGGGWQAAPAESAHGINLQLGANKRWAFSKGIFAETRVQAKGKYYWDSKHYNEAEARVDLGGGFQNARQRLSVLPFVSQTWYAGGNKNHHTLRAFVRSHGISTQWQYLLAPKWQLHVATEYARNRYQTRQHLNGNSIFATVGVTYIPNPRQYWQLATEYNHTRTRDADDSFRRRGLRLTWGQEWSMGVSSNLSAYYAQRRYLGPMPIFNRVQDNREYGFSASIWHRNLHFAGITPRLTWSHQRNSSTIPLYNYRKNRVFLELSKQF